MATVDRQTLTIANGAQTSSAFNAGKSASFGLQLPAAITGSTITFMVSADGGVTYQALYDASGSTLVTVNVTQGRSYALPDELCAWSHFKIVSGSAEGGARSLIVTGKRA